MRALEGEIEEKLKALDRVEEEAKSGGAAPEGSSKREQREAFVKIQRECKDERIKLQKEKQKIKEARIKRRTRAKYDAKLKAISDGAAGRPKEEAPADAGDADGGYASKAKPAAASSPPRARALLPEQGDDP